ncbi:MAG: hypothetical protein H6695_18500 [Deferribacteres bacterium]|nr:hypothetical protein [candidate division KSB1 bacterium]MCB9512176.1 hypothetical protein [Deferribacteres bacterium]
MHEKVHVFARSIRGKVEPIQFIFKNKRYLIRNILATRQEETHNRSFYFFTVDALPGGRCELHFELKSGEWLLQSGDLQADHHPSERAA